MNLFAINQQTGRLNLAYLHKASIDINVIISEQITPNPQHSADEMKKTKTLYIVIACVLAAVATVVFLGAFAAVYKLKKQVRKNHSFIVTDAFFSLDLSAFPEKMCY